MNKPQVRWAGVMPPSVYVAALQFHELITPEVAKKRDAVTFNIKHKARLMRRVYARLKVKAGYLRSTPLEVHDSKMVGVVACYPGWFSPFLHARSLPTFSTKAPPIGGWGDRRGIGGVG